MNTSALPSSVDCDHAYHAREVGRVVEGIPAVTTKRIMLCSLCGEVWDVAVHGGPLAVSVTSSTLHAAGAR